MNSTIEVSAWDAIHQVCFILLASAGIAIVGYRRSGLINVFLEAASAAVNAAASFGNA